MKNKELQELLKEYPEDAEIRKHDPVQGDSENTSLLYKEYVIYDSRFEAIVFF